MTPPGWAFQIGDTFRLAVGDDMAGVVFQVVSRDVAHGTRTYLLACRDPQCRTPPRIETEGMLLAMRKMAAILGDRSA